MRLLITEVHNFGGFFGGDTVTFSGNAWDEATAPLQTLTVDEAAFTNIRGRHFVAAGMLVELLFTGQRVDAATLLAAHTADELRAALTDPAPLGSLPNPLILHHFCPTCNLWIVGEPRGRSAPLRCRLADHPLPWALDAVQREWYNPHNSA